MSWLIYLFGSGLAFFVGVGLVVTAAGLFGRIRRGWLASLLTILALVGVAVIALSAAPLSYWYYGAAGVFTLVWLIVERRRVKAAVQNGQTSSPSKSPPALRGPVALRWATAAIWIGGALIELPTHFTPPVPAMGNPPLYIVGDSVTAGAGAGEKHFWPDLLPSSVDVHNLAQVGATASSALRNQCDKLPNEGGLVLLEIGGNDLLGDTPARQFERDLDQLLVRTAAPGRTILMFELPLPPLSNECGRIQRRLAARHGVRLIPKRILMSILAGDGATLDSIHLSAAGHERMAQLMWRIIEPAYDDVDAPRYKDGNSTHHGAADVR